MVRQRNLDFMKGLCIIFVIVTHFKWTSAERKLYLFPYWIDMAIPLFMMITGYVYFKSYERYKTTDIEELYSWNIIFKKILRFLIPFSFFWIAEVVIFVFWHHENSLYGMILEGIIGGGRTGSILFSNYASIDIHLSGDFSFYKKVWNIWGSTMRNFEFFI